MSAARLQSCSGKMLETCCMVQGRKSLVRADGTKHCGRCDSWLPLADFGSDASTPTGIKASCRKCYAAYHRRYYVRTRGAGYLKKFYGLTLEQYDAMLSSQKGKCAICQEAPDGTPSRKLVVDHCHTTGVVRGILCQSCNQGVGRFRDDPSLLHAAVRYLEAVAP